METCDSDKSSLVSGENLPQQSTSYSQSIPGNNLITSSQSSSSSYSPCNQDELLAIALNLKAGIEHLRENLAIINSTTSNVDQLLSIINKFGVHINHVNLSIGKEINRLLYVTASPHRPSTFALPQQVSRSSSSSTGTISIITKGPKKLKISPNEDDLESTQSTNDQLTPPNPVFIEDLDDDDDDDDLYVVEDDSNESEDEKFKEK